MGTLASRAVIGASGSRQRGHHDPYAVADRAQAEVDLGSLGLTSEIGARVAQAAQTYGIYVVDRHGGNASIVLYATPTEVSEDDIAPLRAWWEPDGQDLINIRDALRIVNW